MVVNSMSYAKYESYKDSGVDWLGEIPSTWTTRKLKHIVKIHKRIIGHEGIDVLSITQRGIVVKDITSGAGQLAMDYSKYQIVEIGDFAMNHMDLLTGYVDISKFEGVVSPDYRVFKNESKEINDDYLLKIFQIGYNQKIFYKYGQGVSMLGRWRLPAENFNLFSVPIPSTEEQTKIIEFLDQKTAQIDQAIALKQQQIEKLNEYKQIVIQNAVTKGLNPNAPMKNSGVDWIGDIPEHWDVKKNTHLFNKIGSGTTPTSSDLSYYDSGDINWLQTGDLNNDYIVATSRKINQKAMSKFSSLKLYDENSLVIAMYGATIGKVGLLKIKSTTNQACCVLGNSDKVFMKYIFYVMQFAKNHLISNSYGGGQPNINQDMIKNLRIPYPNLQEQEKIANYLDDLNEKIYKTSKGYQTQIDRLKEYKNILINQAVTGKIKI